MTDLEDRVASAPQLRIGHISDVHFGRIADPFVVEALKSSLERSDLDLLVLSGDLTQRAFPWQYEAAARFIGEFSMPVITVPGNHDVYPWWRPVLRLTDPLRRYRQWISDDLNPTFKAPGLAVFGLSSAHGWTIKGGKIDDGQRRSMEQFFSNADPSAFRVVTVHHHLTKLDSILVHDLAFGAAETLSDAADLGVEMIMCGHLHVSHVAHCEHLPSGRKIVVSTAGTATSDRGRGDDSLRNFYNEVHVHTDRVDVVEHAYDSGLNQFSQSSVSSFERIIAR